MLFSSITFLGFFLPLVLIFYYVLPSRTYRNSLLLVSSLIFYAWGEPKFIILMLASVLFNFNAGLFISQKSGKTRKFFLILSIIFDVALLFVFKYLGFTCRIFDVFINHLHLKPISQINLVLPLGISFYTFQEISYLADVYKNPNLAEKNVLNFALFVSFFPQLVAGPIVRFSDLQNQISARKESVSQFAYGARRFTIGLSKKVLIANFAAAVCDAIYNADFFSYGTALAWLACFAYTLQIYYDFSGYSDMAIGLAALFGFSLPENFNYPYSASSVSDFWRRWHMTLTGFFRDYVYIPLGGNRKGKLKTLRNRMTVFLLTGIWHGASFNFIFWGIAHGILVSAENLLGIDKKKHCHAERYVPTHAPATLDVSASVKEKSASPTDSDIRRNDNLLRHSEHSEESLVKVIFISIFRHAFVLLVVALLWVLFRNGTKMTVKLWLKMIGINYTAFPATPVPIAANPFEQLKIAQAAGAKFTLISLAGILAAFPWWKKIFATFEKSSTNANCKVLSKIFSVLRDILLLILLVLCFASLASGSYNPFIYFRF